MSNEIVLMKSSKLQAYYGRVCAPYGVSCRVFTKTKYLFSDKKERYLVFGVNGVPEDLDVKNLYVRNERSNSLFYTDYHVVKIDEDSDMLGLVDEAVSYSKTVEFLKRLFAEFKTPLPQVIHGDEITGLREYNSGRNNVSLSIDARANFKRGLEKFFKQENTRIKYLREWRAFSRTDKYDRKASLLKMFKDFLNRDSQVVELNLLRESNDNLNTAIINEHEFVRFREEMKQRYPDVLYAVSEIEVENGGFDRRYKDTPIHRIKSGPFGKLVTYQAYCELLEDKFATEGFGAIKDLNPAYYETRQLTYKEIDEPFVASVLNSIRFAYAKSDGLDKVRVPGTDMVSFIDMPVDDMMNFVSLAKANNVPFYLDFSGKFGQPNFEKLRVVYSPLKDAMMHNIVERIITEKCSLDHIKTTPDDALPLENRIKDARHVQIVDSSKERNRKQEKESR